MAVAEETEVVIYSRLEQIERVGEKPASLLMLFYQFDNDMDGSITFNEFQKVLLSLSLSLHILLYLPKWPV